MKVLHAYSGNLFGGVETLLLTLARERNLCTDMEPHFVLCYHGRLSQELASAEAHVHMLCEVRARMPWTVLRARRELAKLLAREKYDVVVCHSCWPHAMFAPVVRRANVPLVFWAHDAPRGRHWLERWAQRTPPDLVLANSLFTESRLNNLFDGVRTEVLYYPVSPPAQFDVLGIRTKMRAELKTPEDAVVIIQTSRLEPWKGQRLLLEALNQLKQVPGWVCWITGGAQRPHEIVYLDEMKSLATESGIAERVRFVGQRSDVSELLGAADIHCQPNTGPEPFGIAFVEALYAGLPVVTTSIGAAIEIVADSCGVLVPVEPQALAESLNMLVVSAAARERLGAGSSVRATALCDPKKQLAALHRKLTALHVEQRAYAHVATD